jgi:hypothetical protein
MSLFKLQHLERTAKEFGASVEVARGGRTVNVHIDAPEGKQWACDGIACLLAWWYSVDTTGQHEAVKDAIERMRAGLEAAE